MNDLLTVYNICGISGKDNTQYYLPAINNILAQEDVDNKVVVSTCCNPAPQIETLKSTFGDKISFNINNDIYPVNVTFNHSVREAIKRFGNFKNYMYVDSGCIFTGAKDLKNLYELHKSKYYGMTASRTSTDLGIKGWFGMEEDEFFKDGPHLVSVGKTVNLHVQIFSHDILEYYENILPDIFASFCTESVFSFICSAIKKQFIVSEDVKVDHLWSMDGASSGFPRPQLPWTHTFRSHRSMEDLVLDEEGTKLGFGYEECNEVKMHDPSQFDENHLCINDGLKKFLKDNLYLDKDLLDYDNIRSTFNE